MAHLIKLESGDYLNLDQLVYIDGNNQEADFDTIPEAHMVGGRVTELSPKDLEKIEKIASQTTAVQDFMKGVEPTWTAWEDEDRD